MHENLLSMSTLKKRTPTSRTEPSRDAAKECTRYEQVVRDLGGVDLQLLGLGHNGHIGFNEPADEYPKETHIVDLQESTIEANKRFFASIDDVPRQAYTMGIGTIMSAKKILLVVSGEDKAAILREVICGPGYPSRSCFHFTASPGCDGRCG